VALAESAMAGAVGVDVELGDVQRLDATLFGEAGARAVVSVEPEDAARLVGFAARFDLPAARIGVVGGDRIVVRGIDLPVSEAAAAWESALPALLDG
ncbi:MAG: phosphoribosylformylglycinamidine synthase II, partial [Chloroflexi bacterium]|nr:phosphoribosylformylglycinamidine synthase II [Chloroflexota bacterium]